MFTLSNQIRAIAKETNAPQTRENLQAIGNSLREKFGPEILVKVALANLPNNVESIVIDGIRNPAEALFLKNCSGILLAIDSKPEIRLERYLSRAKIRQEDGATEETFWKSNDIDLGVGESSTGQRVGDCLLLADYTIQNDTSETELELAVTQYLESRGLSPEGLFKRKEY